MWPPRLAGQYQVMRGRVRGLVRVHQARTILTELQMTPPELIGLLTSLEDCIPGLQTAFLIKVIMVGGITPWAGLPQK